LELKALEEQLDSATEEMDILAKQAIETIDKQNKKMQDDFK